MTTILNYYLGVPAVLSAEQEAFRAEFDPKFGVNDAHATMVAPFPALLMTLELDLFFSQTVAEFRQQELVADGFYITPRGHIFYTFDQASAAVLVKLYDALYEHPSLHSHKNISRPFMPHITIAKFDNERSVPESVIAGLPALCQPRTMPFDCVRLYGILDLPKQRAHVRDYMLSV